MLQWWRDLSVSKKLYAVVGLMAILIASELFTLLFAMNTLSSVRAFVFGEGLWTKSQKDAIHALYQYALRGDEKLFDEFQNYLKIPAGDHAARLELAKPQYDDGVVRAGFLAGENHPDDVDGMINLLVRFHSISFLREAITAWTAADLLLDGLRETAIQLHQTIQSEPGNRVRIEAKLTRVAEINSALTRQEIAFSSALGAGSRWLEKLLMTILALTVLTIESTGLFLTVRFSQNLSQSLKELRDTATAVGLGQFSSRASVRSRDELGQLAEALNKMTEDLAGNVSDRQLAEASLQRLNEKLEERVLERTEELKKREMQLALITSALPVMVGQVDRQERLLFANAALSKYYAIPLREIIGKTFAELLGPKGYAAHRPYLREVFSGRVTAYELQAHLAQGDVFFNITLVPEFGESGEVDSFVFVTNDVTKYKEIEGELKKAKEAADVANATKSTFLANMSHEIRTPLGAILGFSELMLEGEMTPAERVHGVEVMKRNGQLLSNVINDILDLSKVEAGKLEIEKVEIPFGNIITEVESLLSLRATEKGIDLSVTAEGALPRTVKTDPLRLRQILLNIVGNAIKFTDKGSVKVRVKLTPGPEGALKLGFFIKDTGRGLSSDQVERLFTAFTQADASTTRKYGGTGLGLVLSKKLAQALGGDVVLSESTLDAGSTFVVTIDPGAPESVLFQNYGARPEAVVAPESPVNLTGLRVLVVDDSPDNQALVTHFLRKSGVIVELASNGQEAVNKVHGQAFELILMDLQMPVMDGYEAFRLMRAQGIQVPIIALTAHAMKAERIRSLEHGFQDHLAKPLNRALLLQTVARYAAIPEAHPSKF